MYRIKYAIQLREACRSFAESVLLIVPYRCENGNLSTNLSLSMSILHSLFFHSGLRHLFYLITLDSFFIHSFVSISLAHLIYLRPCDWPVRQIRLSHRPAKLGIDSKEP
jgi:hypothetical protein